MSFEYGTVQMAHHTHGWVMVQILTYFSDPDTGNATHYVVRRMDGKRRVVPVSLIENIPADSRFFQDPEFGTTVRGHGIGPLDIAHASTGKGRPNGFNDTIRRLMSAGF